MQKLVLNFKDTLLAFRLWTLFYIYWTPNHLFSSAVAGEVSEAALVRDILYVFQGIDGKYIKMSAQENCYKMDTKVPRLSLFSINSSHVSLFFFSFTRFCLRPHDCRVG